MFCTLAAWLIAKAGHHFEQPQEYDDPNAIISKILSELRSFVSAESFFKCISDIDVTFINISNSTFPVLSDYLLKGWTDFSYLRVCTMLMKPSY